MIYKSYVLEKNISLIKNNKALLIYGENLGLKRSFKNQIKLENKDTAYINYTQEDILKNETNFLRELNNSSLFVENKIFFIDNCNDKIFKFLEKQLEDNIKFKIIIFAEILDKKSKLRNYFEKSKNFCSVACYQDNRLTIQNIIASKLKGFKNLTTENINLIIKSSGLDRLKLENEINKIQNFFLEKSLNSEKLAKLLNYEENEDFNQLKDEAIKGNKIETNNLLNNTFFEPDKCVYYLALLSQRLMKLEDIYNEKEGLSIEDKINNIKPPIFWKDKPNIMVQLKRWESKKIKKALQDIYDLDIKLKSNSNIDKSLLVKKSIVDLCNLANV